MNKEFYSSIEEKIKGLGFKIVNKDLDRPWGAFFVIKENQAQLFSNHFFRGIPISEFKISGKLSPKILIVNPNARLSWQYHNRRAEIWQVWKGEVGVRRSFTNREGTTRFYSAGDQIRLIQGERHRLIGSDDYAVVAEIWQHTDAVPSDEDDLVRVSDDYKRD